MKLKIKMSTQRYHIKIIFKPNPSKPIVEEVVVEGG